MKVRPITTEEQANELLAGIGKNQLELGAIGMRFAKAIEKVTADFEALAKPTKDELEADLGELYEYAEAHRDELLDDDSKTAILPAGELSWRTNPAKVTVTGEAAALAAMKRLGLTRFIRTVEEINKAAILEEPSAVADVKGLSISQSETFYVKPTASMVELARPIRKPKAEKKAAKR